MLIQNKQFHWLAAVLCLLSTGVCGAGENQSFSERLRGLSARMSENPPACSGGRKVSDCVGEIRQLVREAVADSLSRGESQADILKDIQQVEGTPVDRTEPMLIIEKKNDVQLAVLAYYIPWSGRAVPYTSTAIEFYRREGSRFVHVASRYGFLDNHRIRGERISRKGRVPIVILLHGQDDHLSQYQEMAQLWSFDGLGVKKIWESITPLPNTSYEISSELIRIYHGDLETKIQLHGDTVTLREFQKSNAPSRPTGVVVRRDER